jgi:uncharacterized phage-associated protein
MADAAVRAADRVYDARAVANYLIQNQPGGFDALQVMKLTYIAHGFTLAMRDKPLIEDDVEAWKYGPAIRRVYSMLPRGSAQITTPMSAHLADFESADKKIVDDVRAIYGGLSGLYLSGLTHNAGSPWHRTWNTYGRDAVIPQEVIKAHYVDIMAQYRAAQAHNQPYQATSL